MKFAKNINMVNIECFTPTKGVTLSGTVTPTISEVYKLASAVDITLDGITVTYDAGDEICLRAGITYTFGSAVNTHRM